MIVTDSPLLESYAEKNNAWSLITPVENKNMQTLIGNLLFVTRPVWLTLLFAGFLSCIGSYLTSWSWRYSMLLFVPGVIGSLSFIIMWWREGENGTKQIIEQGSRAEYQSLVYCMSHLLDADVAVLQALPTEDLKELASKKLKVLAGEVLRLEQKGEPTFHARQRFRDAHAAMFKLGLVPPQWDRYFAK